MASRRASRRRKQEPSPEVTSPASAPQSALAADEPAAGDPAPPPVLAPEPTARGEAPANDPSMGWTVSSRSGVPADARHGAVRVLFFTDASAPPTAALTASVRELLEAAVPDAIDGDERAVGRALQLIVRALLGRRPELEAAAGATSSSTLVFLDSKETLAFAQIGGQPAFVLCDDQPFEPLWRNLNSGGAVARAFFMLRGRATSFTLAWSETNGSAVDARWGALLASPSPAETSRPAVAPPTPSVLRVPDPPSPAPTVRESAPTVLEPAPAVREPAPPLHDPVSLLDEPAAPITAREIAASMSRSRIVVEPAGVVEPPASPTSRPPSTRTPLLAPLAGDAPALRTDGPGRPAAPVLPPLAAPPPAVVPPTPARAAVSGAASAASPVTASIPGARAEAATPTPAPQPVATTPVVPSRAAPASPPRETPAQRLVAPKPQRPPHPARRPAERVPAALAAKVAKATRRSMRRSSLDLRRIAAHATDLVSQVAAWRERPTQTTWIAVVLVGLGLLFGLGIVIGRSNLGAPAVSVVSPGQRLMNSLGLGSGTYVCQVESEPPGAQIAVDGKAIAALTPVDVELGVGTHQVALTLAHEGGRIITITGQPHARVPLHASLFGTVQVSLATDHSPAPVSVRIDGDARGFAPIRIGAMTPGAHELEFSSPGQRDWTRAVDVHVDGLTEVIIHPVRESPTGVLLIRSWVGTPDEVAADAKARVWVDGVSRGKTPLTLELPAGPHSVRAELEHESSAVQVIDLPGGNQRYANLTFGGGRAVTLIARTEPGDAGPRVTVTVPGVRAGELLSMWLHVYSDGSWKRIPMTYATTRGSCQGGVDLPASRGSAHPAYYVSATRNTGEEYFTEIHDAPASQALSAMP